MKNICVCVCVCVYLYNSNILTKVHLVQTLDNEDQINFTDSLRKDKMSIIYKCWSFDFATKSRQAQSCFLKLSDFLWLRNAPLVILQTH